MAHYRKVLTLLRNADVPLKLKKRSFFAEKTNYLQQVIQPGRLELLKVTNADVRELNDHTT